MHPLDGAARLARRAAVLLIFISAPLVACAQDRFSFLNAVNTRFGVLQQSWYAIISIYAQRLFWGLAAIDFGWTALTLILDQNDLLEFFGVLVRKIITLGFFFGLLKMAGVWIPDIIDSFRRIGAAAGAVPATTTPDGVVNEGYELALGAFQAMRELGVLDAIAVVLPVVLLAVLIFLAFLLIAAQLLVTQIESYLCIGAGVILLGFGGARWTEDIAATYMRYALLVGLKLMILYLVIGAGQTLFDGLKLDPNHLIHSCLAVAGSALVYAYLTTQVPAMVRAMLLDTSSLFGEGVPRAALRTGAAVALASGSAAIAGVKALYRRYASTASSEHELTQAVNVERHLKHRPELYRAQDEAQIGARTGTHLDSLGLPHRTLGSKPHPAPPRDS
ncbi:Putative conjugal transfer protein trbL [Candidatus Glomeribacter gigasporarum BEG34]|uniref:Putative conjugal transfer protein trbL n=1 Tax=Candidatus Glomeribacter gigasporarum BEG34 TaxID=1070319 RepID=G2J8A8_9BURK|nr:P-type conjugative transfer protein TrbL [Candidatus Glomeribacter gigasporarum]CCD29005.1 Putative conjugal transfer protein trbL [Candidatus Glomeribacter gigasporarum BEG34]